jgi:hypothetical protein
MGAGPHRLLAVIRIPVGSSLFAEGKIPFHAEPGQLRALSPVPIALARFPSTGHLTILESGIRSKPASTDAARTFAAAHGFLHLCLSAFPGSDDDSMPISFRDTTQDNFSMLCKSRREKKIDSSTGGFNNRCGVRRQQRSGGSNFPRSLGP